MLWLLCKTWILDTYEHAMEREEEGWLVNFVCMCGCVGAGDSGECWLGPFRKIPCTAGDQGLEIFTCTPAVFAVFLQQLFVWENVQCPPWIYIYIYVSLPHALCLSHGSLPACLSAIFRYFVLLWPIMGLCHWPLDHWVIHNTCRSPNDFSLFFFINKHGPSLTPQKKKTGSLPRCKESLFSCA